MSRHRLYQNYDYDNDLDEFDGDEFAEEEEEEELSPEDKAQMTAATAEVKSMLGPQASKVPTQQIQQSLWHYYYDVDKTIAYLISKFIDPTPKPPAKTKVPKTTPQASDGKTILNTPFHLLPLTDRCRRSRSLESMRGHYQAKTLLCELLCRHALVERPGGAQDRFHQAAIPTWWWPTRRLIRRTTQNVQVAGPCRG